MGCFSSFQQASKFVEVAYIYYNLEGYLQDNWKVNDQLTLDYGARFVRVGPAYDRFAQATNFLPDEWTLAQRAGPVRARLREQRESRAPATTARPRTRSPGSSKDRTRRSTSARSFPAPAT